MGKKKSKPYKLVHNKFVWNSEPPEFTNIHEITGETATRIAEKVQYSSNIRRMLCDCFLNNASPERTGCFQGKIQTITRIRRNGMLNILFKPLHVAYNGIDGTLREGTEAHVWIVDNGAFKYFDAKKYDYFEFTASVYLYDRGNKDFDFALKNANNVRRISAKTFNQKKNLRWQPYMQQACTFCIYQDECNQKSCRVPEWRKELSYSLANPVQRKNNTVEIIDTEVTFSTVQSLEGSSWEQQYKDIEDIILQTEELINVIHSEYLNRS